LAIGPRVHLGPIIYGLKENGLLVFPRLARVAIQLIGRETKDLNIINVKTDIRLRAKGLNEEVGGSVRR
jgi:hypothetical protein